MRKYIVCVSVLILAACSTQASGPSDEMAYKPIQFEGVKATSSERAMCEKAGGEVIRTGKLGAEHCVQDLPDAGEVCSDDSDCLGRCVIVDAISEPAPGTVMDGVCEATDDYFGCTTLVNEGVIVGTLCVD